LSACSVGGRLAFFGGGLDVNEDPSQVVDIVDMTSWYWSEHDLEIPR